MSQTMLSCTGATRPTSALLRRENRRTQKTRRMVRAAFATQSFGPCSCHGGEHLSDERKAELVSVCEQIGATLKGITACDEGPGTIGMRLKTLVWSTRKRTEERTDKCCLKRQMRISIYPAAILDRRRCTRNPTRRSITANCFRRC